MSKDANKEISNIININEDARNFYKAAQLETKSLVAMDIFKKYEATHGQVVDDLQNFVASNGGKAEADSTAIGAMQKVWGTVKAKVASDTDESLISSLEEAEDRCIHSIKDAIGNDDIPTEARMALKRQEGTLQQAHDYMKIMKDNAKAA